MTKDSVRAAALADRKDKLLLDGAICRLGILQGKTAVVQGLRMDSLVHNVVLFARSGTRFQTLLPLAVAAFSYLSRNKFLKPLAVAGLVVGTAVALLARVGRRKTSCIVPD